MNRLPQSFVDRGQRLLNLADFAEVSRPVPVMQSTVAPPDIHQYILRMMVRSDVLPLSIPDQLDWLRLTIHRLNAYQRAHGLNNPFIYVTVRHGILTSSTDDEWHVDGFSMRKPHTPEQNYICFDGEDPTEYLIKAWQIPATFDPLVHNIHTYFHDFQKGGERMSGQRRTVYAIDPYCVHRRRRSLVTTPTMRTFWRISFVPIEIEDDTCTPNPLFPPKKYGNVDIRKKLVAWR